MTSIREISAILEHQGSATLGRAVTTMFKDAMESAQQTDDRPPKITFLRAGFGHMPAALALPRPVGRSAGYFIKWGLNERLSNCFVLVQRVDEEAHRGSASARVLM